MRPDFWKLHPNLPIFAIPGEAQTIVYTPGHVALMDQSEVALLESAWQAGGRNVSGSPGARAAWLEERAQEARAAWKEQTEQPFRPECLTLYLSNACNVACSYCWAGKGRKQSVEPQLVSIGAVRQAAEFVAESCRAQGRPFQLVAHGGGEPTAHPSLLRDVVDLTRSIARSYGIGWQSYVATNGLLDEALARWLASHFDRICLSCDGPPEIHDSLRRTVEGGPTSAIVERTAAVFRRLGKEFEARVTVTPATADRQTEIVDYLVNVLGARVLRFEPVYAAGPSGFRAAGAADFVTNFLAAQDRAAELCVSLEFPGVRLDEVHGAYCQPFRQVLNLTPSGSATACFKVLEETPEDTGFMIGHAQADGVRFRIDQEALRRFSAKAATIPDQCHSCLNIFHCSRACPDLCPVATPAARLESSEAALFRCRVARLLAIPWIRQAARTRPAHAPGPPELVPPHPAAWQDSRQTLLAQLPDVVDRAELERAFEQAANYSSMGEHRMPLPAWRTRPFDFDGPSTWRRLQGCITERHGPQAVSLYVHFPYCDRHCGFCDCLSRPLPRSRPAVADAFVQRLTTEIQMWARLRGLEDRRLTTIHFGGGTPNCLPAPLFEDIVSHLRAGFHGGAETEWALESTTSLLTEAHLDWLYSLGFRRLHVGVQTLDDRVREAIGRKEDSGKVKLRLEKAIERGFTVSADMIYGLPGQTLGSWISGIQALLRVPIHGLSLYQLNISGRNRRFLARIGLSGPDHLLNYLFFQVAEQILLDGGYEKRFFNHFSRGQDRNLYSLHASRGEDLVALGPTADGVFSDLTYRHSDLDDYLSADLPAFEGGMIRSEPERLILPWSVALMSGRIRLGDVSAAPFAESFLSRWLRQGLLAAVPNGGGYRLTANGSWFISQMIDEIRGAVETGETR